MAATNASAELHVTIRMEILVNWLNINECHDRPYPCDPTSSFCVNTDGSYKCKCRAPCYHSNGDSCQLAKCPDLVLPYHVEIVGGKEVPYINECHDRPCDPTSSYCVNTDGSYKCKCPGLVLPDHVEIVGGKEVPCKTTYEFSCSLGYRLSGPSNITCFAGNWSDAPPSCVDIDECRKKSHVCDRDSHCVNTNGSYKCLCDPCYSWNGDSCEVIQCPSFPPPAHARLKYGGNEGGHTACNTTVRFECLPGYNLSGPSEITCKNTGNWSDALPSCLDINECHDRPYPCDPTSSYCVNTDGSYKLP
ncbi:adhesion G protein-coupled receptor E2-like [Corticium candelabrum]|uniref:adhesion G protein-coupled receptor E2-like n=1 Tax=Corticium candelabrum TaxID=121492 RepID=UPI002E252EB0|nr:adhesion G protein-coupled receptor E2-like [Corticium candelabrum]